MIAARWVTLAGALSMAVVGGVIAGPADAAAVQGYIVVLDPSATAVARTAASVAGSAGVHVDAVFEHALDGFVTRATPAAAARLAGDPRVAVVELDRPVRLDAVDPPTGLQRIGATTNALVRIDGVDDVRVDADVAVIDTGMDLQHPDLVVAGSVNCITAGPNAGCASGGDDDHFHGTQVAGIIGAKDNGDATVGVAPGVRLWAVKVLDSTGNGLVSNVIRGVDWVTANAGVIDVANLSLGVSGYDAALDLAIRRAVDAGVAFAVAAGNARTDAGGFSPAMFPTVLTVSALADFDGRPGGLASPTCSTDIDDTLADFSNSGAVVDVIAPGVCIESTLPLERGGAGTLSGTSMAAPHVAGALALLARAHDPVNAADVAAMYDRITTSGRADWTDESGDGVLEPRLDVSDLVSFQAAGVPSCPLPIGDVLAWWTADGTGLGAIGPALTGQAAYTPSTVGGSAFSLNGASMLSAAAAPTTSGGLTVEGWFRLDVGGRDGTLVSRWDHLGPEGSRAYLLTLNRVGQTVEFWTDDDTTRMPGVLRADAPELFDHGFHHVAATWDTRLASLFVDGHLVASQPSQGGSLEPAAGVPLRIGGSSGRGDPIYFRGAVDDLTIWRRALTPLEVAEAFLAGAAATCA